MTLRDTLEPFFNKLPAVASPEKHVHFKDKLWWTLGVLLLYFALANVPLFGMSANSVDLFESYRAVLAGAAGSLILLGIGPIVTASIVLQLLVGSDIIKMDLSDPKDQAFFQGAQKFLVFIMIILEALPQLLGGYIQPDPGLAAALGVGLGVITFLLLIQIFIGGALILFMDEVVSKWGIGSGVGLFIVAGISEQIVTGIVNWQADQSGLPIGLIPKWVYIAQNVGADYLFSGQGIMFMLVQGGILALVSTVLIFLLVVYVESTRIEIPLAHSAVRGARGRFPVKLIYSSVLPMILVRALQANIQMVGIVLAGRGVTFLGEFSGSTPINGIMYYLSPIHSPYDWIPSLVQESFASAGAATPAIWQIMDFMSLQMQFMLVVGGIIFALFWIETTGMGAKPTAQKIFNSGMQIPGFRRNISSIEKVMQRYIPKVTVIGGAFIGILTLVASLLGTLGECWWYGAVADCEYRVPSV